MKLTSNYFDVSFKRTLKKILKYFQLQQVLFCISNYHDIMKSYIQHSSNLCYLIFKISPTKDFFITISHTSFRTIYWTKATNLHYYYFNRQKKNIYKLYSTSFNPSLYKQKRNFQLILFTRFWIFNITKKKGIHTLERNLLLSFKRVYVLVWKIFD